MATEKPDPRSERTESADTAAEAKGERQMKGPPHQDTSSHHSSPTPGQKQTPLHNVLPKNSNKSIKKMPEVPQHKVKHSEPVGRPRNRNYE